MVGSPSVTLGDRPAGGEDDDRAAQALTRPRAAVAQDVCVPVFRIYGAGLLLAILSPCFLYIYIKENGSSSKVGRCARPHRSWNAR
jgi:hypothetical protein